MKRAYYFFKQTIQKNRLAHLYLISGPKGCGKSQLVDEVAFLILSQNKEDKTHLKQQIEERKVANMMVVEPDGLSIKKGIKQSQLNLKKKELSIIYDPLAISEENLKLFVTNLTYQMPCK